MVARLLLAAMCVLSASGCAEVLGLERYSEGSGNGEAHAGGQAAQSGTGGGGATDAAGGAAGGGGAGCRYVETVTRTEGLHAYWRLGESAGPTAANEVSSSANGTYEPVYMLGERGAICDSNPSAAFSSGGYVHAGSGFAYEGDVPFSVEAWFMIDDRFVNPGAVAAKTGENDGWLLFVTAEKRVVFQRRQDGFVPTSIESGIVDVDTFHHVVATYDSATMRLYVDSLETSSDESSLLIGSSAGEMTIGASNDGLEFSFLGVIDDVSLYERALPAQVVQEHHAAGAM
jgi:hypothetical protein